VNPLSAYWSQIKLALWVAAVLAAMAYGHHKGAAGEKAKFDKHLAQDAIAAQKASEAARKHEQQDAANSARIAEAYEKGKADAEAAGKRVADGLRAGTLKLRKQWAGCEDRLSGVAAGSAEPDAAAADRAESVGRITRAVREADEQIKGLQDVLRAERK
jgi:flagellar biosynthesis/type III secretory pathway protein FliH